jgi:hypothetical protein
VEELDLTPEGFFALHDADFRPAGPPPTIRLEVHNRYEPEYDALEGYVGRLAAAPVLDRIRDVRIDGGFSNTTDEGLRLLANESALMGKLGGLSLCEEQISDAGLLPILESPHLSSLCELAIDGTGCTEAALHALLRSDRFRKMKRLNLSELVDGGRGLRPFATPGRWPDLRYLCLCGCGLDDLSLRGLMRPGAFPALTTLNLSGNTVHSPAIRALLSSGVFPNLRQLALGGTPMALEHLHTLRAEFGHRVEILFPERIRGDRRGQASTQN